ncbi:MAG: shikimate dehydrogenase [Thermovirgaceae bacterium]|nr:shikimate dehydrogenase [Thermovirgaceae bacterium]
MTGAATGLICLLGNPVEHSLSPVIHNAAFRHLGLDMRYMAFCVDRGRFPEALQGLKALGCQGANVTVPYKEEAFPLVERLDPAARELRAVNTVIFRDGVTCGYNTDVAGVRAAIHLLAPLEKSALLLGAGGAGRAAALVLAREGFCPLGISNRDPQRAGKLVDDMASIMGRSVAEVIPWGETMSPAPGILVNSTSLGLRENPWSEDLLGHYLSAIGEGKVLDLVYSPHGETSLVAAARAKGLKAQGGKEVLLRQGAEAFRLFTRQEAPLEVMRRALAGACEE